MAPRMSRRGATPKPPSSSSRQPSGSALAALTRLMASRAPQQQPQQAMQAALAARWMHKAARAAAVAPACSMPTSSGSSRSRRHLRLAPTCCRERALVQSRHQALEACPSSSHHGEGRASLNVLYAIIDVLDEASTAVCSHNAFSVAPPPACLPPPLAIPAATKASACAATTGAGRHRCELSGSLRKPPIAALAPAPPGRASLSSTCPVRMSDAQTHPLTPPYLPTPAGHLQAQAALPGHACLRGGGSKGVRSGCHLPAGERPSQAWVGCGQRAASGPSLRLPPEFQPAALTLPPGAVPSPACLPPHPPLPALPACRAPAPRPTSRLTRMTCSAW